MGKNVTGTNGIHAGVLKNVFEVSVSLSIFDF